MSTPFRPNEAFRRRRLGGHVVHVHQSADGRVLYVPIVPAWGAAGLKRAMERLDQAGLRQES